MAPLNLQGNEWRIRWQFLLCALRIKNMRTAEGRRESDSDGYSCLREERYSQCSSNWLIWMTGRGWSGGVRLEALSALCEALSHPWLSRQQRRGLFWKEVVRKSGWVQSEKEWLLLRGPKTAMHFIYFIYYGLLYAKHMSQHSFANTVHLIRFNRTRDWHFLIFSVTAWKQLPSETAKYVFLLNYINRCKCVFHLKWKIWGHLTRWIETYLHVFLLNGIPTFSEMQLFCRICG